MSFVYHTVDGPPCISGQPGLFAETRKKSDASTQAPFDAVISIGSRLFTQFGPHIEMETVRIVSISEFDYGKLICPIIEKLERSPMAQIENLIENRNFGQKLKFSVENQNFGGKLKLWSKIEILVENRNFGQNLKF